MRGLPRQFHAGMLLIATGSAAALHALQYDIGTAAEMGPGYFPLLLSIGMIASGLVAAVQALRTGGDPLPPWPIGPLVMLVASIVVFALLISRAGLFVTVFVTVLVAMLPLIRKRPIEVFATALALSCFSVGVFVYGLGLNL